MSDPRPEATKRMKRITAIERALAAAREAQASGNYSRAAALRGQSVSASMAKHPQTGGVEAPPEPTPAPPADPSAAKEALVARLASGDFRGVNATPEASSALLNVGTNAQRGEAAYADYRRGDTEYHVYDNPGGRQVMAFHRERPVNENEQDAAGNLATALRRRRKYFGGPR